MFVLTHRTKLSAPDVRPNYIFTPLVFVAWHPRREMQIDFVDTVLALPTGRMRARQHGQSQVGDPRK